MTVMAIKHSKEREYLRRKVTMDVEHNGVSLKIECYSSVRHKRTLLIFFSWDFNFFNYFMHQGIIVLPLREVVIPRNESATNDQIYSAYQTCPRL